MTSTDDLAPMALVVGDDPIIRMNAVAILEDAGFRPLDAANADEAVDLLLKHKYHITLVFTDVEMPGSMNGFALARHVAKHWPHIGVLVASGGATAATGDLPDGAVLIRKPFSAEVVHARIQELLPDGAKPEPLKSR